MMVPPVLCLLLGLVLVFEASTALGIPALECIFGRLEQKCQSFSNTCFQYLVRDSIWSRGLVIPDLLACCYQLILCYFRDFIAFNTVAPNARYCNH